MKPLFLTVLGALAAASAYTGLTLERRSADRPVIHWKSDANPQRYDQIDLFHAWLKRKGHVDAAGEPRVRLALDAANNQSSLIQAVSGVGGDVIDAQVHMFAPLGVTRSLEPYARAGGFDTDDGYPGLRSIVTHDGEQHGYPCNLVVSSFLLNLDALERGGVAAVPEEWTPDEFEALAKRYVAKANEGLPRRLYFFGPTVGEMMLSYLARSQGADQFNETFTRATCGDERYVRSLALLRKWTYEDHLFPTAAEAASVNTSAGYGGASFSQFQSGRYASLLIGRYAMIRFREMADPPRMASVQPPMFGFKNLWLQARTAVMYSGTPDPETARLFFEFLADREYNEYIVEHADGLPPNPRYALGNPRYLAPPGHPNEGNLHANELSWAMTIAIPRPLSPYFKGADANNWITYAVTKHFNGLADAASAMAEAEERYNAGIDDTVAAAAPMREQWGRDWETQQRIDRLKGEGRPIPASWIRNPYHLAYYARTGRLAVGE